MRMVYARKMGHRVGGPAVAKAARSMTAKQAKEFSHMRGKTALTGKRKRG